MLGGFRENIITLSDNVQVAQQEAMDQERLLVQYRGDSLDGVQDAAMNIADELGMMRSEAEQRFLEIEGRIEKLQEASSKFKKRGDVTVAVPESGESSWNSSIR